MKLSDTKPKIIDVEPIKKTENTTNVSVVDLVGPIPFAGEPTIKAELPHVALTTHQTGDDSETMIAELALVQPGKDVSGTVLALKLRMSPKNHVGPTKLSIPLVVLPEGGGLFDKKNARWTTIEVDLGFVYEQPTSEVV